MNIAICGPRHWYNYELLKETLDELVSSNDTLFTGGATGTDQMAERYSRECLGKEPFVKEAEWSKYGLSAGPYRNSWIANRVQKCIAFQPSNLSTKGTQDMVKKCRQAGVPVHIVRY
jgi:hypothetical protein